MRTKLFIGSVLAVVLAVGTAVSAGAFTKAKPSVSSEPVKTALCSAEAQTCCTLDDCCLECILCCSFDGCCEECIQCCIDMGCDPFCCFPALTAASAETPKAAQACCTKDCCDKAAKKVKGCGVGCCK
jgi:hypothetical protein